MQPATILSGLLAVMVVLPSLVMADATAAPRLPPGTQVLRDDSNGSVRRLKGTALSAPLEQHREFRAKLDGGQWAAASIEFLKYLGALLRLNDAERELAEKAVDEDSLGFLHVRLAQRFGGLPVWESELIVHWDARRSVYLVEGDYIPTPTDLDIRPKLNSDAARQTAERFSARTCPACAPELGIWRGRGGAPCLAYRIRIPESLARNTIVTIDAESGRILEQLSAPR